MTAFIQDFRKEEIPRGNLNGADKEKASSEYTEKSTKALLFLPKVPFPPPLLPILLSFFTIFKHTTPGCQHL